MAVDVGAIAGLTSVILVMLLGQSRVFYSPCRATGCCRAHLLRDASAIFRTPYLSNLLFMVFAGLAGGFMPISSLGHMTSFGTLLAFIIVCIGVLVLRRTDPSTRRAPSAPPIVAGMCRRRHCGVRRADGVACRSQTWVLAFGLAG